VHKYYELKFFFSFILAFATPFYVITKISSTASMHNFSSPITLKLNKDNFLLWKQHVLATINELNLRHFLDGSQTPSHSVSVDDGTTTNNPAYVLHKQQDNLVVSRLLTYMATSFLTQMVDFHSATQI